MSKIQLLEKLVERYNEFAKTRAPQSRTGKKVYDFLGYFSFRERTVLYGLCFIFLIGIGFIIKDLNKKFTIEIPVHGGSFTEGIIGIPRFINPVLAVSEADKNAVVLIYSGLMRVGTTGVLIPDLAKSYTVSPDGRIYTFILKDNIVFHDGVKVTSADVAYTIQQIKNPNIKSPKRGAWDSVTVEIPDLKTVIFKLKDPYALFLENTTLGILPKHLWEKTNDDTFAYSELNLSGIGSGPYSLITVEKDTTNTPSALNLHSFNKFTLGEAYITTIHLKFFSNETDRISAYKNSQLDAISDIAPDILESFKDQNLPIIAFYLPRVFGVFFNQNKVVALTYPEVRHALDLALDKEMIAREVLKDFGTPLYSALAPGSLGATTTQLLIASTTERINQAKALLKKNGWTLRGNVLTKPTKNKTVARLSFSISTANTPDLKLAAELVKKSWESLGAEIEIKLFEVGDLNQNIIRSRRYESLLYGGVIGRNPDPYFFWHSSERNDPGLNIALYANKSADSLIEKIRIDSDTASRAKKLHELSNIINSDTPATFLYAPKFIYLMPRNLKGISPISLTTPEERFSNIYEWYVSTERLWKIFDKI